MTQKSLLWLSESFVVEYFSVLMGGDAGGEIIKSQHFSRFFSVGGPDLKLEFLKNLPANPCFS